MLYRRRAIATAEIFGSSILNKSSTGTNPSPHRLIIRKDLLDDSNAAKEPMDRVKKRLKVLLRPGEYKRPEFAFAWRVPDVEPQQVVQETVELLKYHRASTLHLYLASSRVLTISCYSHDREF